MGTLRKSVNRVENSCPTCFWFLNAKTGLLFCHFPYPFGGSQGCVTGKDYVHSTCIDSSRSLSYRTVSVFSQIYEVFVN